MKPVTDRLLPFVLPLVAFAALEWAVSVNWVSGRLLPAPSEILNALFGLGGNIVLEHVGASVMRVLIGFVAGSVLAMLIGSVVALSTHASRLLDPSFQALRAIPSLAWVPLLLLWFGIDETPKLVLIAIGAFFPVYMGVTSGIANVDRKWIEVGSISGLGPVEQTVRILLPAAAPAVLTGLRSGLSLSWMFLVAAELIAATKGIGYLLTDGRETGRADLVLVAILLLAVLGKISDSVLKWLEGRCLFWRDTGLERRGQIAT
jgi:sulfonate transport system permease protein